MSGALLHYGTSRGRAQACGPGCVAALAAAAAAVAGCLPHSAEYTSSSSSSEHTAPVAKRGVWGEWYAPLTLVRTAQAAVRWGCKRHTTEKEALQALDCKPGGAVSGPSQEREKRCYCCLCPAHACSSGVAGGLPHHTHTPSLSGHRAGPACNSTHTATQLRCFQHQAATRAQQMRSATVATGDRCLRTPAHTQTFTTHTLW